MNKEPKGLQECSCAAKDMPFGRCCKLAAAPVAIMDTRIFLSLCAPSEEDFPALYALQGHRVALVDLGSA